MTLDIHHISSITTWLGKTIIINYLPCSPEKMYILNAIIVTYRYRSHHPQRHSRTPPGPPEAYKHLRVCVVNTTFRSSHHIVWRHIVIPLRMLCRKYYKLRLREITRAPKHSRVNTPPDCAGVTRNHYLGRDSGNVACVSSSSRRR